MIIIIISNNFYKDILINYFYFFIIIIISSIISFISFRNSILDNRIASYYFLSLRVIILKNKDLRDIEDLNIKVVKFI